jgi:prepilin-type N-terminal cleavage/methylation domain-containing protein
MATIMKTGNHSGRQATRQQRGFSLLELMIVVVLIAGILAIAWPSIARPMRKAELSEATQKLREAIEDGRYQAMMSGEPVFLQITEGDSQLRSGGIQSLINGELDETDGETDPTSTQVRPTTSTPAKPTLAPRGLQPSGYSEGDSGQPSQSVATRVWKLPENIVVASVQWMDEETGEEELTDSSETPRSAIAGSGETDGSGVVNSSYASATSTESDLANIGAHEKWCLPMTSQGRGRDAEITLLDKRAGQTLTVTFTSATGELEIVR